MSGSSGSPPSRRSRGRARRPRAMLGQLGIAPAEMPTSIARRLSRRARQGARSRQRHALRADAEQVLRTRLVYEGTRLDLIDKGNMPWWLMSSDDEAAIKAVIVDARPPRLAGRDAQDDGRRRRCASSAAIGTPPPPMPGARSPSRKFMAAYPAEAIAGMTTAGLGSASVSRRLAAARAAAQLQLAAAGGDRRRW